MKVSFVIPTLNQAPFIRRCIDSCLTQELPDFEIIVRDGGSTDGTLEILADYGDRIQWTSEMDSGQADAVNKAIQAACGEIIAWINSDDYYAAPRVLADLVARFKAEEEVDVIYGDGAYVSTDGKIIRQYRSWPLRRLQEILVHPCSFVNQPAVLFRRELFERVGGLNVDLHWTLDYDLWLRMFPLARRFIYVPVTVAHATLHADAKSIRGVWLQVRETAELKRRYARNFQLNYVDRLRVRWGNVKNHVYAMLVSCGLYRLA